MRGRDCWRRREVHSIQALNVTAIYACSYSSCYMYVRGFQLILHLFLGHFRDAIGYVKVLYFSPSRHQTPLYDLESPATYASVYTPCISFGTRFLRGRLADISLDTPGERHPSRPPPLCALALSTPSSRHPRLQHTLKLQKPRY